MSNLKLGVMSKPPGLIDRPELKPLVQEQTAGLKRKWKPSNTDWLPLSLPLGGIRAAEGFYNLVELMGIEPTTS